MIAHKGVKHNATKDKRGKIVIIYLHSPYKACGSHINFSKPFHIFLCSQAEHERYFRMYN